MHTLHLTLRSEFGLDDTSAATLLYVGVNAYLYEGFDLQQAAMPFLFSPILLLHPSKNAHTEYAWSF